MHCTERRRREGTAGKGEVQLSRRVKESKDKQDRRKGKKKANRYVRKQAKEEMQERLTKRKASEQRMEDMMPTQMGGRTSGADKLWERRCKLQGRVERRSKMLDNNKALSTANELSMQDLRKLEEDKDRIKREMTELRREIWKMDDEVRWAEAAEEAEKKRGKVKREEAERMREKEEQERERMREVYWG